MQITKFDHSCFYIEKDGRGLLFDPVEYGHELPDFNSIDTIVITHKHGDHFQPEVLNRIRANNPDAEIFMTADNVENVDGAKSAKNGDKVKSGAFDLEFYGGNHACIVSGVVPCQNIGAVVDDVFANSGDSFDLPPVPVKILSVPITAPWMKVEETMNYITAAKPEIVVPRHDALCSELGDEVQDNWIQQACDKVGAEYRKIHFGRVV